MIRTLNKALVYLAYLNDDSHAVSPEIVEKLMEMGFIYKVGNGYFCTDAGAQKAELIEYPEITGKLLFHPTYDKLKKKVA